ncbi:hypothetical protein D3OALGA1CA_2308 [Olavius algarvensis associated proteobacterium Delta 3]|nr:hypothetical protein D3OALGA1CA_2308 [Olavius algarvensis associated proteobacterium Delta 3]
MKPQDGLIQENLAALQQAVDLIEQITDDQYTSNDHPIFKSGVGKHVRHILDFYAAFLGGEDDRVNYDARQRSSDVETNRKAAIDKIHETMGSLKRVTHPDTKLVSKNDDCGERDPAIEYSPSSVGRELQFLASHTVHHYAIVAMILHSLGVSIPKDFGIAPSTLAYWRTQST